MSEKPTTNPFLDQLTATVEKNIADERFGVAELADAMNMSRSNLLRKVKKEARLSVSQLISQIRLQRAMELLRTTDLNVSEVSSQVGFNSPSYFIKCFRERYGYPPGEVGKHRNDASVEVASVPANRNILVRMSALVATVLVLGFLAWRSPGFLQAPDEEKSIAVLPFKNDSNDSTNLYLINGLMEATLNNLQKIKDLRVVSRTSVEKYRYTPKAIPEMAGELNVRYFVEGSGQKIDDRILLNIQLIDGTTDRHLWSRQYRREVKDIFALQEEIAKDIAAEIEVIISPEVKERIEKVPTQNLEAYDAFLKGIDALNRGGDHNLHASIAHFQEAIARDNQFALAYACAGIAYYYLDMFKAEKEHVNELGNYADKALLYDPDLAESWTAKAMYYLLRKEYKEALPYLEKGSEYNPNSTLIIGLLADFYYMYLPNTGKYLEYALKGMRLNAGSEDSVSASYFCLRLANALIQTGFTDKSLEYIDKSLEYNPHNPFSRYLRAFVLYARDKDLNKTKQLLVAEFSKDTSRLDILQDIGKVCYYLKEYDSAYYYYKRFNRMREARGLDVYRHENMTIGLAYEKVGEIEKGSAFIEDYRQYLETDQTVYKDIGLCVYYQYKGESAKAIEHLRRFAKQDNIQYWPILFMDNDQFIHMYDLPECRELMKEIEQRFWANHEKLKLTLEEKGLL